MGRIDDAISDFTRAIELNPQNAAAFNSRGLCYDKKGMLNEALMDFTAAIDLESSNPVFWHNRGFCYRNL